MSWSFRERILKADEIFGDAWLIYVVHQLVHYCTISSFSLLFLYVLLNAHRFIFLQNWNAHTHTQEARVEKAGSEDCTYVGLRTHDGSLSGGGKKIDMKHPAGSSTSPSVNIPTVSARVQSTRIVRRLSLRPTKSTKKKIHIFFLAHLPY